jgi:hypothetical protein
MFWPSCLQEPALARLFEPAIKPAIGQYWRLKGFQKMESTDKENLFFTCPIVCSKKSVELLRKKTLKFIEEVLAEIKDSPSEELVCLNIDWFRF